MTLKTLPRAGSQQDDRRLHDSFRNGRVSRQVINGHQTLEFSPLNEHDCVENTPDVF